MRNISKLLCLASCISLPMQAQRTPEHPLDIQDAPMDNIVDFLDDWLLNEGHPNNIKAIDDEFYVSRTRPLPRITDGDYQVRANDPNVKPGRKMALWVPLDDPTSKWKSLPRYCFEGDNFGMWSYIDVHGNWTAPWARVTAGLSDVAAKNGVTVGCVNSVPWAASVTTDSYWGQSAKFTKLCEKDENGDYKWAAPLVKMMKYYGINALGCNSEFYSDPYSMEDWIGFIVQCHKEAEKIGWKFEQHWYDGTDDNGNINFDQGLGEHNKNMFGDKDNICTDMLFANYNWSGWTLETSAAMAENLGRNSYDYYAGFDIQGRGLKSRWAELATSKISIGFWGAHSQSLLHQSSTDYGTADVAVQQAYLDKQEFVFSGGNRNPALVPFINESCGLDNAGLKGPNGFHGIAALSSAKSTIQQVPFVTRFSLGNGVKFYNEGEVTFDHKWYNLSMQDFLPTWRWWITDAKDEVTYDGLEGLAKAELKYDDAYIGGSCLSLSGETAFSRVKLFKTMLTVQPDYEFSLVYKTLKGTDTHAKFFVALKNNVTTYKEIAIPATKFEGEWTTYTVKASELGLSAGDQVAMMGISLENTPAGYDMRVGEMALRDPAKTFAPVAPKIKEVEFLRGRYNACDFKVLYSSDETDSWEHKVYNDDVDTWYFEIYFQQDGQPQQLLTRTTSWAAYVVDAPMVPGHDLRTGKIGVRAVSPDGKQASEISWSDPIELTYNQPLLDVVTDKPVIKPGEDFVLKYLDPMNKPAQKWEIIDPLTQEVLASSENSTECAANINKVGVYDLRLTDSEGTVVMTRGKVQISPEETGAVPSIESVVADKASAGVDEEVQLTYEANPGTGSVSRALVISDPKMFMVPGDMQQGKSYTYALWFKADKFSHDKQGTNLINKNSIADSWPHNNWGDLWVTIRPEYQGKTDLHAANEVSFNTMGWEAHDSPNEQAMTTGYSVTPGVWCHIAVTHDASNNQKVYFNGKKVAETNFYASKRREDFTYDNRVDKSVVANIFIGGGGVYKSGFNGVIDELQVWDKPLSDEEVVRSMQGYKEGEVPEGLQGYYTFEAIEKDGTIKNYGHYIADGSGKVVVTEGAGGEGTANAAYVQKEADNDALGVSTIPGSMKIESKATWKVPTGTQVSAEGNVAVYTFTTSGQKNVTLEIENNWGKATKTVENIVEIGVPEGIEGVEGETEMSVFPNPFVESVNLRFAQAGQYTINVIGVNGAMLQRNAFNVQGGDQVNVAINGAPGMYLLQVLNGDKLVKTLKVLKK